MIFDISERSRKTMNDKEGSREWVRLPLRCLQDSDISVYDTLVLAVLLDYIDGESKAMSVEKLMQKTGLSDRQIQKSIKALIDAGYITAERRAGKKTIFTQCEVLPPKRQPKPKKGAGKDDFDVEKYEKFISDFETDFYTGKYAKYKEG